MEVIVVGTAAIDVVHEVATYPEGPLLSTFGTKPAWQQPARFVFIENSKARSLTTYKCRGGNAANALVLASYPS